MMGWLLLFVLYAIHLLMTLQGLLANWAMVPQVDACKSVYGMVPIHPQDCHLFGICWDDRVYVDQALPFGLRSAPKLFSALADALGWAMQAAGFPLHIYSLDNFLFLCLHCPTVYIINSLRSWVCYKPWGSLLHPTRLRVWQQR